MSTRRWAVPFALAVFSFSFSFSLSVAVPSFGDSQARIVRLSQVDVEVQIDRNTGQGYEKAFLNLPVTQGAKLRTGPQARAEVEFENGSTLRITPGTVVEFQELSRRDSGARASNLALREGTAYLNFKGDKGEEFTLDFGKENLALTKPVHLRVELKDADATVAVFKGDVEINGPTGKVSLEKNHSATFDLNGSDASTLAKNLEPDPYDDWDKQQEQYHQRYSASNSYSPFAYGASDLNYYGSFYNMPGYGMMWQPYLVGAGWDPFMNGAWAWYPGAGYAWVSGYPWGWTPYRYGSWTYVQSYGWFWQPGTSWTGWNTVPRIVNAPQRFSAPRPPVIPGQTLMVNRGMPVGPVRITQGRSEIRDGSAGLGVARGSVRNLGKVAQQMERMPSANGTMRAPTDSAAARLPSGGSRVAAPRAGGSMQSAPSAASSGSHMSGGSAAPSSHGVSRR